MIATGKDDVVARLRDGPAPLKDPDLNDNAADEIELLRKENAAHQKAATWCDKHKPTGGARGHCVICSGIALSAALSRISYACDTPNEMGVSAYDLHQNEDAVVAQVQEQAAEIEQLRAERDSFHMDYRMKCDEETKRLAAESAALRKDAERYRWLRNEAVMSSPEDENGMVPWCVLGTAHDDCEPCELEELDAAIDAAMKWKP